MSDKEQETTDSAARLIAILRSGLTAPQGQPWLNFWATAFNLPAENILDIYRSLDLTRELTDDTEKAINEIPDIRHEQYLRPLAPVRGILSRPNIHEGWHSQRGVIEMAINGLEFASERLQAHSPEVDLPASELAEIGRQTAELIKTLGESQTIPKSLKLILFDLLSSVQRSINEYKFRGIRGVRRQLFVIASQIQENFSEFEKNKNEPEVKSFFTLLKRIDSVTAAALHVKELISAVAPLLPMIPMLLEHVHVAQ
jgi:hypothetical protein